MDQPLNVRRRAAAASQSVVEMVEANIASGRWAPGTQLPTERALEAEFGVARNTLRKYLKHLEAAGKIVRQVGRGAFVAEPAKDTLPVATLRRLSDCSPADVMEVRLMLEPRAAELAATRASFADVRFMSDCLASAAEARETAVFEHWDALLHKAIIEASRNYLLAGLYEAINAVRNQPAWKALKERTVTPQRREQYQAQHTRLVSALQDRDSQRAHDEMRAHLLQVRANILGE
jgi:DNA-binding FadR family transcriptional regulator